MRILIVSEGKNELHQNRPEGALAVFVRKLLGQSVGIERRDVRDIVARRHIRKGIGDGMQKKAESWLRFAQEESFDALVLLIDHDDDPSRPGQFEKAQGDLNFQIPRALGVAIRSFDAWMLADEAAISKVLAEVVNRLPDPESLDDPKERCHALCSDRLSLSDFYEGVANQIRIDELEKRCPKGFAPFAKRVRALVSSA